MILVLWKPALWQLFPQESAHIFLIHVTHHTQMKMCFSCEYMASRERYDRTGIYSGSIPGERERELLRTWRWESEKEREWESWGWAYSRREGKQREIERERWRKEETNKHSVWNRKREREREHAGVSWLAAKASRRWNIESFRLEEKNTCESTLSMHEAAILTLKVWSYNREAMLSVKSLCHEPSSNLSADSFLFQREITCFSFIMIIKISSSSCITNH